MKLLSGVKGYYRAFATNELSLRFINLLSVDLFVKVIGLALMFVYMRIMSIAEYGVYGLIFNLISSVSLFLNFGLYVSQATYFQEYKDRLGLLIFNLNIILVILFTLLGVVINVSSLDLEILHFLVGKELSIHEITKFRKWIWVGVITQSLVLMLNNYLVMNVSKIRIFQFYSLFKVLIVNVLAIIAISVFVGDKSLLRVEYTVIVDLIITIPFLFYYLRRIEPRLDFRLIRKSLIIGIPVMCTAFVSAIQGLVDRRFLLEYTSSVDLGIYTYCVVLTGNLWVLLQSFISAYLPSFLEEKDVKISFANTWRISKKIMLLLGIVGIGMIAFALFVDFFGLVNLKYKESLRYMPFLLLSQLFLAFGAIWASYYFYFRVGYMQLISATISLFVNILICYFLISEIKIWGAVIASITASIVGCCFNFGYAYYRCMNK